ncbi:MAG: hypothetical protein FVQ79_08710 [Planctomycetes bacterium]|nr:hypothetical protein [Planctomycetota bacterium]
MGWIRMFFVVIVVLSAAAHGKTVFQLEEENAKMEARIESQSAGMEKQAKMLLELQTKNKKLEKMVETLKKTRNRREREMSRMKRLLVAAGLNPTQERRGDIPNFVEYKGNWYSKYWFDLKYKDHRSSISLVDGKPVSVTKNPIASWFKVMQVMGPGDVLAIKRDVIIRINDLPGEYIDGERLPPNLVLIPAGRYQYINTLGSNKTVAQYKAAGVATEEQFLQAIRDGYVFD